MKLSEYIDEVTADESEEEREAREFFKSQYAIAMQFLTARRSAGLTQVELAQRAGVDQAEISRIERGVANPTESTLIRVADALGQQITLTPLGEALAG